MKKTMAIVILSNLAIMPAFAEKPAQAGGGKMDTGHYESHTNMESRMEKGMEHHPMDKGKEEKVRDEKSEMDRDRERLEGEAQGLEKQKEMKADQEMKEADKGSEQGQEAREEHSRKWWKFWE